MSQEVNDSESSKINFNSESFSLYPTHTMLYRCKRGPSYCPTSLQHNSFQKMLDELVISQKQMHIIIGQYLHSNGYEDIAARFSAQCGYELYQSGLSEIRSMILTCEPMTVFNSVESLLPHESQNIYYEIKKALFVYYCSEILKSKDQVECLKFIRKYCCLVKFKLGEIYEILQMLIYYHRNLNIQRRSILSSEQTLDRLIQQISVLVPHASYSSNNRLETLMKYSLLYQFDKCSLHSSDNLNSEYLTLFTDHSCRMINLPSQVSESFVVPGIIAKQIIFSHNGEFLAVSTLAKSIFIYYRSPKTCKFSEYKVFRFDAIPYVFEWSYDDSMLLVAMTCGQCIFFYRESQAEESSDDTTIHEVDFSGGVKAIAWIPDNIRYVVAMDDGVIYIYDLYGNISIKLEQYWTNTLAIMGDSQHILFSDHENTLIKWNFVNQNVEELTTYSCPITNVLITPDCEYALLSSLNQGIVLFHLRFKIVCRCFYDIPHNYLASNCAFYPDEHSKIFVTGNTQGTLKIYHMDKSQPVNVLSCSTEKDIVDVSWNPKNPNMIASITENGIVNILETDE